MPHFARPDFSPGGAAGLQFVDGREDVANQQIAMYFQVIPIPAPAGSRAAAVVSFNHHVHCITTFTNPEGRFFVSLTQSGITSSPCLARQQKKKAHPRGEKGVCR
ncbi:MAG: hypothetical protein PVH54_10385 [Gammaproteobacteria bacterium]|jgi:hypothetical protein